MTQLILALTSLLQMVSAPNVDPVLRQQAYSLAIQVSSILNTQSVMDDDPVPDAPKEKTDTVFVDGHNCELRRAKYNDAVGNLTDAKDQISKLQNEISVLSIPPFIILNLSAVPSFVTWVRTHTTLHEDGSYSLYYTGKPYGSGGNKPGYAEGVIEKAIAIIKLEDTIPKLEKEVLTHSGEETQSCPHESVIEKRTLQ